MYNLYITNWIGQLFSEQGFMPHGHCYLWNSGLLGLHIGADALIALSYYSIPFALLYFFRKRKNIESRWTFACFAVFILASGTTHLMEIWTVWHPTYWFSGVLKALTAITSVPTAFLLIRLVPKVLALASPASLKEANRRVQCEVDERTQVEAALRKSHSMFQRLFENTPDATMLVDRTGQIIRANSQSKLLFGAPGDELVGKNFEMLLPDRFRASFGGRLASCLASLRTPTDTEFELDATRKEGVEFPVEIMLSSLEVEEGLSAIVVIRDITERKRGAAALAAGRRAEIERDQFFELSRDLFSISDLDGRFKRLNPAWEKTLGYMHGELLGQFGRDLIHPDDKKRAGEVREQILGGAEAQSFELRYRCRDGSYRWVLCNSVSDLEQNLVYFTGRDITNRKANEVEIQSLNVALGHRAAELELLNAETEAFSYSVSHDLHAPLRHVGSFARLLAEHPGASFDATGLRYLGIITNAVKQMGKIIDDLLAFARTGRTSLSLVPVDLDSLVAEVVRNGHYGNDGHPIDWRIGALNTVQADAGMLRQVWINLLGNAVKYSGKNSHPCITIAETSDTAAGEHVYSVRDNGVGFDMAHVGKLFGAFQRLHESSEFEGTGIGLANVRRIVSRHGGRTWAEGKVGEGAVFYFSLPFTATSSSSPGSNASSTPPRPIAHCDYNAREAKLPAGTVQRPPRFAAQPDVIHEGAGRGSL